MTYTTKSIQVKAGDILAIPIEDNKVAVGMVLHVSSYFANSILVGYFDRCFQAIEDIPLDELLPSFAFTPNYTGKKGMAGTSGWTIIGNRKDMVDDTLIPKLVVVTDVFHKDAIVERLPSLAIAAQYEPVKGQGKLFVENRLRSYFKDRECEAPMQKSVRFGNRGGS